MTVRSVLPWINESLIPFKGTVKAPTVVSGDGNTLQTAHLRSEVS